MEQQQQHAYQVAENLIRSTTPLSHQSSRGSRTELVGKRTSSPMTLVSPLPHNAVIFHTSRSPQESDSSFHDYIDRQFQQDASTLINQDKTHDESMDIEKQTNDNDKTPNTLWAAIESDLHQVKSIIPSEERRPWWVWDKEDGVHSIGMYLFLFGFLFPPLWWIGACWPRHPDQGGKMARRWQQLNRYLSIGFSIILVIVIIVVAALYGSHVA
ncbi:uncharacterized protein BX664DRAFT_342317 [Halteromyces radiatus]|uniref:uncharacterized protein n=1 Tax=Halteromyces radiatus TaxID=101107 RepID=UPI002220FBBA|nr:uncharacterized protein BX664DRAFT_342317 [Halteromyces radiatus]KAI8078621.1 hypothetical protein BX664DRAFT_342317 [Halteromyces radiatus]